ncbi:hypothetical protein [Zophobihabitans entericus]|uniref:Conjugal transfer protein TraD n=1 Tax=Zophobihabitans entericus TaxID=1635327 RepID=A0A6G9IE59_9GAMM|nr:hypothetical protein [Zophobihabitans entericus]QIQ22526.1 hypothetical protein IPMB12_12020 [Zophobihabitans entericus]
MITEKLEQSGIDEVVIEKLKDLSVPTLLIEFTPEEAERAGAFQEDALLIAEAEESAIDGLEGHNE